MHQVIVDCDWCVDIYIAALCSVAVDAMQQFLKSAECPMMLQVLEDQNVWALFDKEDTCPHGVLHLARALAAECFASVQSCVDDLSSSLTSIYDAHRITVVAFYSEVGVSSCLVTVLHFESFCSWYAPLGAMRHIHWQSRL